MAFTKFASRVALTGLCLTLASCGGGGGGGGGSVNAGLGLPPTQPTTPTPPAPTIPTPPTTGSETPLVAGTFRDAFATNFEVGTTMTSGRINTPDISTQLALSQFSSITPEYELKADQLAPTEGVYDFTQADIVVDWAIANGMSVRGHALLWHEATPDYFVTGTAEQIKAKLELHVTTVVNHFKDRVHIWDVVNEVTSVDIYNGENGIGPYRDTVWFNAVGKDYIDWAFNAARAADPNAILLLSDYETETKIKQDWMIEIVDDLVSRGIPIDGVGHQFHLQLTSSADEALSAIDAVDGLFAGLVNHVTELDVNFYQDPGTCWESGVNCLADIGPVAPASMLATQAQLVSDLFDGLVNRPSVESVSVWGVTDGNSWLNTAPTERFNFPLLFDRDGEPKAVFQAITDPNYVITP